MSATLIIPDLDESIARKLLAQASSHGHSVEAEAREILIRAMSNGAATSMPSEASSGPQPFLDLAGSVDGAPDLSSKRGFEA